MTGTLHEYVPAFLTIYRKIILRNILDKRFRENQNTHLMCNDFFFLPKIAPFVR